MEAEQVTERYSLLVASSHSKSQRVVEKDEKKEKATSWKRTDFILKFSFWLIILSFKQNTLSGQVLSLHRP